MSVLEVQKFVSVTLASVVYLYTGLGGSFFPQAKEYGAVKLICNAYFMR